MEISISSAREFHPNLWQSTLQVDALKSRNLDLEGNVRALTLKLEQIAAETKSREQNWDFSHTTGATDHPVDKQQNDLKLAQQQLNSLVCILLS